VLACLLAWLAERCPGSARALRTYRENLALRASAFIKSNRCFTRAVWPVFRLSGRNGYHAISCLPLG
jgi:hypothetical protein